MSADRTGFGISKPLIDATAAKINADLRSPVASSIFLLRLLQDTLDTDLIRETHQLRTA